MTDKERILFNIIKRLAATYSTALEWGKEKEYGVYFASWDIGLCSEGRLKPGMLVLCQTSPTSDWTIGYLVEKITGGFSRWIVKEIDSERLCDIGNEQFLPIKGLSVEELLTGDDYKFLVKIKKAFRRGREDWYRFGGIEIIKKKIWKIIIREKFGGCCGPDMESIPFSLEIKWNKETTIKYILQEMIKAGYGSKKFERKIKTIIGITSVCGKCGKNIFPYEDVVKIGKDKYIHDRCKDGSNYA